MVEPFSSRPSPRIVFGPGALRELPSSVRATGAKSVLLVSDAGIVRAGHVDAAQRLLEADGIDIAVYDRVRENPTESDAEACCRAARDLHFESIVALGGGSSMDTAKACNVLLSNGGAMRDFQGYGKVGQPLFPFVAIPTTAGTGSECQSYALVSRDDTCEKMACGDPKIRAHTAILDPDLTQTQPHAVAVQTGLDALAHALESAVCTRRNAVSALYSEGSFRHLAGAIGKVVSGGATSDARAGMLLGATLSGLAIENSMLGAAHATANPLTARHNVVHGHAVALMLPHVMRFNAGEPAAHVVYDRFSAILRELGVSTLPLVEWVARLVADSALPRLNGVRVEIEALALDAAKQWTAQFNPRPLLPEDFAALYRNAFAENAVS